MSQICRSSKNVSEGNSRSKFVKIAACILAVAFLMVSGCSNGDKKENKTSNSASSTAQQSSKAANSPESALSQFGVKGKVVSSTFGKNPNGFMAKVDNSFYIVDLKNNQIASIENYSYIDTQIDKIRGRDNSQGTLIPQFLIYNDKHGKDDQMGEWRGNNHFLPIYMHIDFDGGTHIRGKFSSGLGANPSHYQSYLEEQKDIDLANLFLREVIPFKDNLDNKAAKGSTNKPVATTTNQTPIDNGYVNGVDVNLRNAPSMNSDVIRALDHTNISVLEYVKDASGQEWAKVRLLNDGTEGYIAKQYFKHSEAGYKKDTEQSIGKGHIVGTNVIMRNGASREADPIGEFKNNESLEILKYENMPNGEQWVKVRRSNGEKGFVFAKYFQKD